MIRGQGQGQGQGPGVRDQGSGVRGQNGLARGRDSGREIDFGRATQQLKVMQSP